MHSLPYSYHMFRNLLYKNAAAVYFILTIPCVLYVFLCAVMGHSSRIPWVNVC